MSGGADDTIRRVLPRGRNALDRETVARSQRARLVEAMEELAAREGIGGVTIAQLVGRAGVAKPTFYEHFDSKEDCFIAVIDQCVEQLIAAISAALDPEGTLDQRIDQGLRAFVEFMAENEDRARVMVIESLAAGPAAARRHDDVHELMARFYVSQREESRKLDPSIPSLSEARAQMIVGAVFEPLARALRGGGSPGDVRDLGDEMVEAVTLLATGHAPV